MGLSKVIHSAGQACNHPGHRIHACSRISHAGLLLLDIPEIIKFPGCQEARLPWFSSLISQLSADSDACYKILSKLYSDNIRGKRKPDIDSLKECMTDVLSLPGQGPIYIIVDALDECPNFPGRLSAREEILEFVEEIVIL
jgi:hypothetical protein